MAQVARLEKKLESCFASKEYYEAHQIYRTIFYRLSAAGKFTELLVLLEAGALRLADAGEFGSAYDLAEVYAETLIKGCTPLTTKALDIIEKIFRRLPSQLADDPNPQGDIDRRAKFVSSCVKWSQSVSGRAWEKQHGSSELHSRFASVLSQEGHLDNARSHFLLSNDPQEFAKFLVQCHVSDEEAEVDPDHWITYAVLQLVCLRRVNFAHSLFTRYCSSHPRCRFSSPPYPRPFLHFSWMLLHIVRTRNISYLTALVARYHSQLPEETVYKEYLDRIGQLYFGVAPKGVGGIFGSLLKGLMPGGEEEKKAAEAVSDSEGDDSMTGGGEEILVFQKELAELIKDDQPQMQEDDDLD